MTEETISEKYRLKKSAGKDDDDIDLTCLLLTLLEEAVDRCYRDDFSLIEKSMEQASVARIYYYMQEALKSDKDRRFISFSQ